MHCGESAFRQMAALFLFHRGYKAGAAGDGRQGAIGRREIFWRKSRKSNGHGD